MLSKRETVLDQIGYVLDDEDRKTFIYGYEDADTQEEVPVLTIDEDTYIAFGSPDTLTVTMEPGDRLN